MAVWRHIRARVLSFVDVVVDDPICLWLLPLTHTLQSRLLEPAIGLRIAVKLVQSECYGVD